LAGSTEVIRGQSGRHPEKLAIASLDPCIELFSAVDRPKHGFPSFRNDPQHCEYRVAIALIPRMQVVAIKALESHARRHPDSAN
jgi:hypothetical protein